VIPTYNRVCLLAAAGKPQEALDMLSLLAARHTVPIGIVERDTDLAAMRQLPGYAALKRRLTDTGDDDVADD
jgi:hypothetical protein